MQNYNVRELGLKDQIANIEADKNKSSNVKNFASNNFVKSINTDLGRSINTDYDVKVSSPKCTSPRCRLKASPVNEKRNTYMDDVPPIPKVTLETTEQEKIDLLQSKLRSLELSDLSILKDISMLKDLLE
ncbi:13557_t:CDS:2 [Cetraspora pellucida]|uniref:13557_t:CDS:1 n=1 Tax=Cetraspora pellucida TaxID=1433469 RepID=A0A9N9EAZ5_9GLOM|nr:13557_t:CDS:2 [Cetraspora pellucida]